MMKKMILGGISFVLGTLVADYIISKNCSSEKDKNEESKYKLYFNIMNMWLDAKQSGKSVTEYIKKQGYNRIAIYGMKSIGERLYVELMDSDIEVVCVIDQGKNVLGDFLLLSPDDDIPPIDLLVVTADYYFNDIKAKMEKRVSCPIISLSGLLGNAFGRNL